MGSLERTAAAVYFSCGRTSRGRHRGRSTALRYPASGGVPLKLSYATHGRRRRGWRPLATALWTFPACWIVTLIVYWSTDAGDGFVDNVSRWENALIMM